MFSRMPKNLRATAAWRISIWTTLAFALGTAVAFSIVYFLVAQGIRERSDTWLSGEAEVLAQVSADTPSDRLYKRVVRVVAGPPKSITVEGYRQTFRVVEKAQNGRTVYLGLSDHGAQHVLHTLARRFLMVWGGMFLLGFVISYWSARRTLHRVERITETVARIGTEDLEERLPEPVNSDEISRLAKTCNRMLDRLQSSVNQLRTVTGAVAHDLKSPVTLIRGTLESALCNEGNEKWRDSVGEAIEDLDRLLQLLNTTLDLAEAEAGALH